jgi:hypothetical protein
MMPFDKGTNHFLVELNGTREADGFASQSLDASSERQVVTLDTLGEYLPGQISLTRHLSGVTPLGCVLKVVEKRSPHLIEPHSSKKQHLFTSIPRK